jgi:1,4-alpha-glucan branching enzyme
MWRWMEKTVSANAPVNVRFTLDAAVGATTAAVCGEWNGWSSEADIMERDNDGGFSLIVSLEPGRTYRFRYLLDAERWENDWNADAYPPNEFGGDDSLIDLTVADKPPKPARRRTTKTGATPLGGGAPEPAPAKRRGKAIEPDPSEPAKPKRTSSKKTG